MLTFIPQIWCQPTFLIHTHVLSWPSLNVSEIVSIGRFCLSNFHTNNILHSVFAPFRMAGNSCEKAYIFKILFVTQNSLNHGEFFNVFFSLTLFYSRISTSRLVVTFLHTISWGNSMNILQDTILGTRLCIQFCEACAFAEHFTKFHFSWRNKLLISSQRVCKC